MDVKQTIYRALTTGSITVKAIRGNIVNRNLCRLLAVATLMTASVQANGLDAHHPLGTIYQQAEQDLLSFQKEIKPILSAKQVMQFTGNADTLLKDNRVNGNDVRQNKGTAFSMTVDKQCYVVVPHPNELSIDQSMVFTYDNLTMNGFLYKDDAFWLTYHHEKAHCAQGLFKAGEHAKINHEMLVHAFGYSPNKALSKAFSRGMQESVSDLYAVLKMQQSYLQQHHAEIKMQTMPEINPVAFYFINFRHAQSTQSGDLANGYDNSAALASVLSIMIQKPELLMAASDSDILMTAFRGTEARVAEIAETMGVDPHIAESIHYPTNYLNDRKASGLEEHFSAYATQPDIFDGFIAQHANPINIYTMNQLLIEKQQLLASTDQSEVAQHTLKVLSNTINQFYDAVNQSVLPVAKTETDLAPPKFSFFERFLSKNEQSETFDHQSLSSS